MSFSVGDLVFLKVSPMNGVVIVDRQVRQYRTKDIPMVKVLWSNHSVEDCVWEAGDDVGGLSLSFPFLNLDLL